MRQVVSFDKLKLTNNELDDQGHVSATTKTAEIFLYYHIFVIAHTYLIVACSALLNLYNNDLIFRFYIFCVIIVLKSLHT